MMIHVKIENMTFQTNAAIPFKTVVLSHVWPKLELLVSLAMKFNVMDFNDSSIRQPESYFIQLDCVRSLYQKKKATFDRLLRPVSLGAAEYISNYI